MASIKFNNVEVFDSNGKVTASGMPSGTVLQVKTSGKNTTQTITSSGALNFQDVSDLSVNITPASGSKILVLTNLMVGGKTDHNNIARIVRGSTAIQVGTASSPKPAATYGFFSSNDYDPINISGHFLDESPGGDGSTQLTYKVQVSGEGSYNMMINRSYSEINAYTFGQYYSSITVIEIKG